MGREQGTAGTCLMSCDLLTFHGADHMPRAGAPSSPTLVGGISHSLQFATCHPDGGSQPRDFVACPEFFKN